MTHERWTRLKEAFTTLRDLDSDEREAYLNRLEDVDGAFMDELRSLMAAAEASGPLDELQQALASTIGISAPAVTARVHRIGPYEILREIGDGGMGHVYLARRADGQFEQVVALKLIRSDVISKERLDRFLSERQILATLNHPNVARLLDGGLTDDGHPYFAMEHVEGKALDVYASDHNLPIERRIGLFLDVCEAVQHAHRALIVHRDLKPSNILVMDSGQVKLLDFGIAKLLDPPDEISAVQTRTGLHPMTPAYATPEQVRGEPITTATDVYQLGVLLYQLLTGVRPFDVEGRTPAEIERVICDAEPMRPSEAAHQNLASARTQDRLRGDLDTIILKALRKEPEQRYPSVEQLAMDLRRHLQHRPIAARAQTWTYRARRFTRRHVRGVAASTIILLLLAAYIVTITWQSERTRAALAAAELEANRSEQVTTLLMDLFRASDPAETAGDALTARMLLERGLERAAMLESQPEVQAELLSVIGQIYSRLGEYDSAEITLRQAHDIRAATFGASHPATAEIRLQLASVLQYDGRYPESITLLEEVLQTLQSHPDARQADIALALGYLGAAYRTEGNEESAEAALQEALALQREVHGNEHPDVASTLNVLGLIAGDRADWEAAEAALSESIDIRRRVQGETHPHLAMSLNNLGMILRRKGDGDGAESAYRASLEMKRRLFGDAHPSTAATLNGLGLLLHDRGDLSEARVYLEEALEMRRSLLGESHPLVAGSINNVGNLLEDLGEVDAAIDSLERARELFVAALGEAHLYTTDPIIGLARIRMKQARAPVARPLLEQALAIRREALPEGHPQVLEVASMLGACLTEVEAYDEADVLLRRTMEQLDAQDGPALLRQVTLERLVELYDRWDRPEQATEYQQILAQHEAAPAF